MGAVIKYIILGVLVSCYYFSFSFTFLPQGINTKLILAALGLVLAGTHLVLKQNVYIDKGLLGAFFFALVFSLVCFIAVDYNHTIDYSYASYIVSFFVWILASYCVCVAIRWGHGTVNFRLLTYYLTAVCVIQCALALLIDSSPAFQSLVNTYIEQDQKFLIKVKRLYGIGASLDNAGVRFSVVLVMIAVLLAKDGIVRKSFFKFTGLLMGFFAIGVLGNVISRTTSLGGLLGLIYMLFNLGLFSFVLKERNIKTSAALIVIIFLAFYIGSYFYHNSEDFHRQIRFGFEGFFNWVEKGEWYTDSTDKLNKTMWIWPQDTKTWIIGAGLFDNWAFNTDIGYCRFILYSGIIGFVVFASFFVYNATIFSIKYRDYWSLFMLFSILTFATWLKVSTDIFLIYALFYSMDILTQGNLFSTNNDDNEDRLLYSRNF